MVFQSALLTWVDDAREGGLGGGAVGAAVSGGGGAAAVDDPSEQMREAIATLWIAYAHFLANAKQFKSATEAYEQAVSCPVARSVGRVWLDYARYAEDRGRVKTAQNVYIRALTGGGKNGGGGRPPVPDEQDQNLLWSEFLEMMRQSNPDLSLASLQQAVESEHGAGASRPEAILSGTTDTGGRGERNATPPPTKRMRIGGNGSPVPSSGVDTPSSVPALSSAEPQESRTHVVTLESVEEEAKALTDTLVEQMETSLPHEISAAWMVRDGHDLPQPPDPPLFEPSPPKLSDPTGRDILGPDLALQLIKRLQGSSGTVVLDVCQALWALQALKEKETKFLLDNFDKAIASDTDRLETNLSSRLAVQAPGTPSYSRIEQMNDAERQNVHSAWRQQRSNTLSKAAWEFRKLLCLQQQLLSKLNVPGFEDGPTVDAATLDMQSRVCSFLHSAFYLRSRIGEAPHVSMLKNQAKRLEKEKEATVGDYRSHSSSPVPPGRQSPVPPPPRIGHSPTYSGASTSTPPFRGAIPPQPIGIQTQQQHLPHPVPQHQPPPLPPPVHPYQYQGGFGGQPPQMMGSGGMPNYGGYPPQQQQYPGMMMPNQQQMMQQQIPPPQQGYPPLPPHQQQGQPPLPPLPPPPYQQQQQQQQYQQQYYRR